MRQRYRGGQTVGNDKVREDARVRNRQVGTQRSAIQLEKTDDAVQIVNQGREHGAVLDAQHDAIFHGSR